MRRIRKTRPVEYYGPYTVGKYDRNNATLRLKRPSGEWQLINEVYPAMFIKPSDVPKLPDNKYFLETKRESERYSRVVLSPYTTRTDVDEILNDCRNVGIWAMEADVDARRRWLSDTGAEVHIATKALFFDLETWPLKRGFDDDAKKQHVIISFAAGDMNGKFWFEASADPDDPNAEVALIHKFLEIASNYDTLLAWNGQDYDYYVLRWRCKKLNLQIDWRNWNCLDYMLVVKKCLMSVTDKSFKQSFSLDNIGFNVLGINKLKLDIDKGRMDKLIRNNRIGELRAYNSRDVEIMIKLEQKREFLDLHQTVCRLCHTFPDHLSIFSNVLGDGIMLRRGIIENRHFKSRYSTPEDEKEGKFRGAFVFDSIIGFHENVQVIDFNSLYPSIMISWNMSQETKIRSDWTYKYGVVEHAARSPSNGVLFRTDVEGILPKVLRELLETRKIYKRKEKEAELGSPEWKRYGQESTAIKVVANSMYGLHGSQYTRWFDIDIAESITLTAQYLTTNVIRFCEDNLHYRIIHADTDSAFVQSPVEDVPEIVRLINDDVIPAICRYCNCRTNVVKIDSDKGFKTLLMQAKKKYCGILSTYKGREAPADMKPEIKGLEFQRPDAVPFAQQMQLHFINLLLKPNIDANDVEIELRHWADKFMQSEHKLEDLVIRQAVKKWPSEYKVKTPNVKAAQIMMDNGLEFFVGMKVGYVITSSGRDGIQVTPEEMFDGKFDRNFYWTNKIVKPTARLIRARFLNHKFYLLSSIETTPNQQVFAFDSTFNEDDMRKKLPPKKRRIRKTVALEKPTTLVIYEKDDPSENTIVGIQKLAEVSNGNSNLKIRIILKNGDSTLIDTNHEVNREFVTEVTKVFPWVSEEQDAENS